MFCRKRYPFTVTVHIDGRHPYLESNELDYETRDIILVVNARNWNDAERQALDASASVRGWSRSVKQIVHGAKADHA